MSAAKHDLELLNYPDKNLKVHLYKCNGYATTIVVFFAHLLILEYPDHQQNLQFFIVLPRTTP